MFRSCRNKVASAHLRMVSFNATRIRIRKITVDDESLDLFMFALFVFVLDIQEDR